jgi:hypothetical protein
MGSRRGPCPTLLAGLWLAALPAAVAGEPLAGLSPVGAGELSWFGFEVYEARLLTASGRYRGLDVEPLALEIVYRRDIESEALVDRTAEEWRRLGPALGLPTRHEAWLEAAAAIWPDVRAGDRIVTVVEPGGATRFYGNAGLLGSIDDPAFGPAFLAIWLHPDTRVAGLRADLVGESP